MTQRDMMWTLVFWLGLFAVAAVLVVAFGCASPAVKGDRTVSIPVIPDDSFVGPPAPVEIDMDSLAGQIVAKLEARLQVMLSAVANVASGNTTYYGWGAAGLACVAWLVQARATKLQWLTTKELADQLDRRAAESNEREMKRIECGIVHPAKEE